MQKILIVNHERCTGCRLCEMVCSVKHTGVNSPSRSRIHVIKWPREGFELPMLCQQCEDAPCVAVCPKDALSRDPVLGRVALTYDLCIGCKLCVTACPFGGMGIDTATRQVIKCDLCDGDPVCVRFCDPGALQFVAATLVNLVKKRDAGQRLSEVMRKSFVARSWGT
ncbi:MAG: 4Fe-4S dicluster domain-containing protein [Anaerolineae bacterium]